MAEARPLPLLGLALGLDLANVQVDQQAQPIASVVPSVLGAPIELASSSRSPATAPKATQRPVNPSPSRSSAALRIAQSSQPLPPSSSAYLTPASSMRSPSAVTSSSNEPSYFIQTISPESARPTSTSVSTPLAAPSAASEPSVPAPVSSQARAPAFKRPGPGRPQPHAPRHLDIEALDAASVQVTPQVAGRPAGTPLSSLLSPGVNLDFAEVSPAKSLEHKKKRSIERARRGITGLESPGGGPLEVSGGGPFKGSGGPTPPSLMSPGVSSPTPEVNKGGAWVGPSIGLAVSLGLVAVGVAAWAGVRHRRRAADAQAARHGGNSSKRHEADGEDRDGEDEEKSVGMRRADSTMSITTFRPMSSMYDSPSTPKQALPPVPARVAVLNTPEPRESLVMNGARLPSPSPPPRSSPYYERVRSSLNTDDFALPVGLDAIVEEEADVAEPHSHVPAPAPSIVDDVTENPPKLVSPIAPTKRCSTSSFLSIDSDRSSCYTTASSGGESVGDISAVTLTDSMPTTPRNGSFADQQSLSSEALALRNQSSASTLSSDRTVPRSRVRAKTITSAQPVEVKVRAHPHKTHSLQAQAGTAEALRAETWAEAATELGKIAWDSQRKGGLREITAVNGLEDPFEEKTETPKDKGKGKQKETAPMDSPIKRPANPHVKQIDTTPRNDRGDQENTTTPTTPGRRQTFPAELLSRRQSKFGAIDERPVRKSEMLGREYFKNTLRTMRGESATESGSASGSPFGSPTPSPSPASPGLGAAVETFNAQIAAQQSQLERYMHEIDKRQSVESIGSPRRNLANPVRDSASTTISTTNVSSPERTALANFSSFAWDSYDDAYDSYYLDHMAESDDEYEDANGYTPQPGSDLPTIQITRH